MARIAPVDPNNAPANVRTKLDQVGKALGKVPNIIATFAQSPAALDAFLSFKKSLGKSSLPAVVREQIALTVAGANKCEYCASAHSAAARGQGVDAAEVTRNLEGQASDPNVATVLRFASTVVGKRGFVSDTDVKAVRDAGYADAAIVEIVAEIALNIFTNYFNQVAEVEIDFPKVEIPQKCTTAACSA